MAVQKYRKRPVEIEAILYDGTNFDEIFEWSDGGFRHVHPDLRKPGSDPEVTAEVWDKLHSTWIGVKDGQYVLRGTLGEHYPHAAENFATSYEPVGDPADAGALPPRAQILAIPMGDNEAGAATIGEYIGKLAAEVLRDGEGFSGKRPFGNSGWESELYVAMIRAGVVEGSLDDDGYVEDVDGHEADRLLIEAAESFGSAAI